MGEKEIKKHAASVKPAKETRKKLKEYEQKIEKQYKMPRTKARHLNKLKRRLQNRDENIAHRKRKKQKQIDDSFKRAIENSKKKK